MQCRSDTHILQVFRFALTIHAITRGLPPTTVDIATDTRTTALRGIRQTSLAITIKLGTHHVIVLDSYNTQNKEKSDDDTDDYTSDSIYATS